jgi:PadR family transcriptional regulator
MPQNDVPGLSAKEYLIMSELVASPSEMYGLELVEQSKGDLKRGTIYVTLIRLEKKGYISSKREPERPGIAPRRLYKPTALGKRVFEAIDSIPGRAWRKEAYAS